TSLEVDDQRWHLYNHLLTVPGREVTLLRRSITQIQDREEVMHRFQARQYREREALQRRVREYDQRRKVAARTPSKYRRIATEQIDRSLRAVQRELARIEREAVNDQHKDYPWT